MKNTLPASGFVLLAGFALLFTGCVAQYESSAPVTSYSGTTLPAAGTVALVMEFRGGEPTPQERADVRALLSDYFSQQGTVLVDDTSAADYLVHAVLERRDPANPSEWTVVETYSANSLRSAGSDEFRWPGGMVEDDSYETTTFSYIGYGVFYPVFFDFWSSPWHRGHVVLYPAPRRHHDWDNDRGREEHRWHRPGRWLPDRHPEWKHNPRRDDNRRPASDRRGETDRRGGNYRPDSDRRPDFDHGRRPGADTPGHTPPGGVQRPHHDRPPGTTQRPAGGGDRRPEPVWPPHADRSHPVMPPKPPVVAPPSPPTPRPEPPAPEARNDRSRRGSPVVTGHGVVVMRPPQPTPPPAPQAKPVDRRPGSPSRMEPGNPEHRRPTAGTPPPAQRNERHIEHHRGPDTRSGTPPSRGDPGNERQHNRRSPADDKGDSAKDSPKH
jgi:hypothetical protein